MCGINGFTFKDPALINSMNDRLTHRGPDDSGVFMDHYVSLGSTRLAILDLSSKGHMPMVSKNGRFIIVFNGEIYNFKELRKDLQAKKYTFKSETDTEVVVNLFAEYGPKAFGMLNGMFACVIYDQKTHQLTLARDRAGIKPLYYYFNKHKLIFSSEIIALFKHNIPRVMDPIAVEIYLRLLFVPAPRSIYQHVYKVEPGQFIQFKNGQLQKQYFWQSESCTKSRNHRATTDRINKTLKTVVRDQLVLSDRPVGLFLSGGIDSNVLLACASEASKNPVNSFSIRFSGIAEEAKFNADADLAKKSAKYFAANHHEIVLSPEDAVDSLHHVLSNMDMPIGNPVHLPTHFLAKESVKHITVALGGDGGDELFGGYDRYLLAWQLDFYQSIPHTLRSLFIDQILYRIKNNPNDYFMTNLRANTTAEKYLAFMGQDEGELQKIHSVDRSQVLTELTQLRGFSNHVPFYQLLPRLDFLHWLSEESLVRSDKMTMLSSLEQRVPFIDNRIVDLAETIPFSWKVGFRERKMILRKAFAKELPEFIRKAPKRGFFSPAAKWIRHKAWQPIVTELLASDFVRTAGIYEPEALKTMYENHLSGKKYNMQHLWAALTLHGWMQETGAHL